MAISASIHTDINFGRIPFEVKFSINNLVSDEEIYKVLWRFGDGQESSSYSPTHTYDTCGNHTVSLKLYGVSGDTFEVVETDIVKGLSLDFREEIVIKPDRYTVQFINESYIPEGYTAESWEWDLGDGSIYSPAYEPLHDYTSRGTFSVTQNVTVKGPEYTIETESGPETTQDTYTYTYKRTAVIVRDPIIYNTCSKFLCIGWIKSPSFSASGNPLYPFVTSDIHYQVLDTNDSIKFSIIKEGEDYRIGFMGAKTKLINKTITVDLNDDKWHSLVYTCIKSDGTMRFLVDGIEVPAETGFNSDGFPYSVAYGETSRPGGGNVWAPFLYEPGQGIQLYNWRFKVGLNISDTWIIELLEEDKRGLGIDG